MLNYIWASLVVLSLVFALVADSQDFRRDTFRNGAALPVNLHFTKPYDPKAAQQDVEVRIDPGTYASFYHVSVPKAVNYTGTILPSAAVPALRFAKGADLPDPLNRIRDMTGADSNELRGKLLDVQIPPGATDATVAVTFEPVRFVKLQAITKAAVEMAGAAITLAIGLVGVLAMWSGLVKIADKSGLLYIVVKVTQPALRLLFPEIPKDHPALGLIALNLTANVLGLGNAATPLGLKAMEELQKLNPKKDTATNSMVMVLALHATAFQITPSAILYAVMGLQANVVYVPILIVTFASTVVAAAGAFLLGYLPWYRRTDPMRQPIADSELAEVSNG
jgi:spore maturation protein A